jgi:nucleoid-associated protein YgaU
VVIAGDTLPEIARRELGQAERWQEIYELNRDKLGDDPARLFPGLRLSLPEIGPQR